MSKTIICLKPQNDYCTLFFNFESLIINIAYIYIYINILSFSHTHVAVGFVVDSTYGLPVSSADLRSWGAPSVTQCDGGQHSSNDYQSGLHICQNGRMEQEP